MRILSVLAAAASAFAAHEVAIAQPFVDTAMGEIADDIKASKPLVAFGHTFVKAAEAIFAANANVGFTGLLGAVANAVVGSDVANATTAAATISDGRPA